MSEQETSQAVSPVELEIVYQDEYFVAVNKPAGMLVHRSWLDKHETQFVMQTLRDQIGQHVFSSAPFRSTNLWSTSVRTFQ